MKGNNSNSNQPSDEKKAKIEDEKKLPYGGRNKPFSDEEKMELDQFSPILKPQPDKSQINKGNDNIIINREEEEVRENSIVSMLNRGFIEEPDKSQIDNKGQIFDNNKVQPKKFNDEIGGVLDQKLNKNNAYDKLPVSNPYAGPKRGKIKKMI